VGWIREISASSHGRQAAISAAVRLGVNPPLAARLPLEVLHRVGDVGLTPIDTGFLEGAIEQLAGRPDERRPLRSSSLPGCSPTSMTRA